MRDRIDLDRELIDLDRLPPLPPALARLWTVLDDPEAGPRDLAEVIEGDPALAAQVLRTVNSAAYGLGGTVGSLPHAVTLLGARTIRNLAVALGFRSLVGPGGRTPSPDFPREAFWEHCLAAAFLADRLSRKLGLAAAKHAYAAGLLHDLGILALDLLAPDQFLTAAARVRKTGDVERAERAILGCTHAEVGRVVAQRWAFPADLVDVIAHHHGPLQAAEASRDLACAVCLADAGASSDEILIFSAGPPEALQAASLHFGSVEGTLAGLREQARARIGKVREVLGLTG